MPSFLGMEYSFQDDVERLAEITEPYLADGFTFLSAGASDGVTSDPVFPLLERWGGRGVAAEPVPYIFDQLVENYSHLTGVTCIPAAIAAARGAIELWYVEQGHGGLDYITQSIGSSSREHLLHTIARLQAAEDHISPTPPHHPEHRATARPKGGSGIPADLDRYVRSVRVQALTFDELVANGDLDHVDLVNLDVEGKDYEVFASIDWNRWQPKVVILETYEMTDEQQRTVQNTFDELGYRRNGSFGLFSTVFLHAARTPSGR